MWVWPPAGASHDLVMIRHLRNPFRGNKCRCLNPAAARVCQQFDKPQLVVRGDDALFILQPVARANLDD